MGCLNAGGMVMVDQNQLDAQETKNVDTDYRPCDTRYRTSD